jgi:phosphohistidine phosphatase
MITLKNVIKNIKESYEVVFLFGHNPGLNMLVEDLCGFFKNIATTGIVAINFDCNTWGEISNQNSKLIEYIYPKKYK